jgi:hypothetical protein
MRFVAQKFIDGAFDIITLAFSTGAAKGNRNGI